jgi:hypothetical protein
LVQDHNGNNVELNKNDRPNSKVLQYRYSKYCKKQKQLQEQPSLENYFTNNREIDTNHITKGETTPKLYPIFSPVSKTSSGDVTYSNKRKREQSFPPEKKVCKEIGKDLSPSENNLSNEEDEEDFSNLYLNEESSTEEVSDGESLNE